jgi:hypothetical protein
MVETEIENPLSLVIHNLTEGAEQAYANYSQS